MQQVKYFLFLIISVTVVENSYAQKEKSAGVWQFHSFNTIGLLKGNDGHALQVQSINGLQYKSWFTGLGVGLDDYRFRTIPLFIDIRKEFGKGNNKLFVYADAGISFYWQRDDDIKTFYSNSKIQNGLYSEMGAGYSIKLNQKLSLLFSAGFSYKKLTEEAGNVYIYLTDLPPGWTEPRPAYTNPETVKYNLKRLVLKAGIVF